MAYFILKYLVVSIVTQFLVSSNGLVSCDDDEHANSFFIKGSVLSEDKRYEFTENYDSKIKAYDFNLRKTLEIKPIIQIHSRAIIDTKTGQPVYIKLVNEKGNCNKIDSVSTKFVESSFMLSNTDNIALANKLLFWSEKEGETDDKKESLSADDFKLFLGPRRLLLLVENNNLESCEKSDLDAEDIVCKQFKTVINESEVVIKAIWFLQSLKDKDKPTKNTPDRIYLLKKKKDDPLLSFLELFIERFETKDEGELLVESFEEFDITKPLDLNVISSPCIQFLPPEPDIFGFGKRNQDKFSFIGQKSMNLHNSKLGRVNNELEIRVAADASLQMLRAHRWHLTPGMNEKKVDSLDLFDLKSQMLFTRPNNGSCGAQNTQKVPETSISLTTLLLGIPEANKIYYSGRALHKGKLVDKYVGTGKFPLWLVREIFYSDQKGQPQRTKAESYEISILLAVEHRQPGQPRTLTALVYEANNELYVVDTYEFNWQLSSGLAEGGDNSQDELFSIHEFCTSSKSRQVSIELTMQPSEIDDKKKAIIVKEFLKNGGRLRNERILAQLIYVVFQGKTTLVRDFDIKLAPNDNTMFVSLILESHIVRLANIKELGKANLAPGSESTFHRMSITPHIDTCIKEAIEYSAAKKFKDTIVVFKSSMHCLVFDGNERASKVEIDNEKGSSSCFSIHIDEEADYEPLFTIDEHELREHLARTEFIDLQVDNTETGEFVSAKLRLVDAHLTHENHANFGKHLRGVGLVSQYPLSWKVNAGNGHKPINTIAECKAECLVVSSCQSVSTCVNPGGETSCILSKIDISKDKSKLSEKLADLATHGKRNEPTDVDLDKTIDEFNTVKAVRNSHCDIHSKRYLGMFDISVSFNIYSTFEKYIVVGAIGDEPKEICAEQCFARTRAALIESDKNWERIRTKFENFHLNQENNEEEHKKLVEEDIKRRVERETSICRHLHYLDIAKVEHDNQKDRKQLLHAMNLKDDKELDKFNGFCIFEKSESEKEKKVADNTDEFSWTVMKFEQHPFRFDTFFEPELGIALKNKFSNNPKAKRDYDRARDKLKDNALDSEAIEILHKYSHGINIQEYHFAKSVSDCARICFDNEGSLWPACKSFGAVKLSNQTQCILNTLTVHKAKTLNDDTINQETRAITYELFDNLVSSNIDEDVNIEDCELWYQKLGSHKLNPWLITFLSLLTFVIGLVAGNKYVVWREKKKDACIKRVCYNESVAFANLVEPNRN